MGFVNKIISRLDSEEKYGPMMKELGIRHVSYGAKPQYVDVSSHCGQTVRLLSRSFNIWDEVQKLNV